MSLALGLLANLALTPINLRAATIFDWDVAPTATTTTSQRLGCLPPPAGPQECFENNEITTVISTISGGEYGVDLNDDTIRDATLSADIDVRSEVQQNLDGTYSYYWQITNHGTGNVTQFLGGNPAGFVISSLAPLVGLNGIDRTSGTADDPPSDQYLVATAIGVPGAPRSEAFGITVNPSSDLVGVIVAPTPSTVFGWDSPPSATTTDYERTGCLIGVEPCTDPRPITGRSCEILGTYGIDYSGDGLSDGTMTGDVRLVSEVVSELNGTYTYWWQIANLGSGPVIEYLGPNSPEFVISAESPLLTTPIVTSISSANPPGSEASGITLNPSSGTICELLAPTQPSYLLSGFYPPVDMPPVDNTVKSGSTVPIKFEVFDGTTELTDTSIVNQPLTATHTSCDGNPTDSIELVSTGATGLRYDATAGQFIYNWKTPKKPGFCYVVTVTLTDGTSKSANFQLK